ncbi:hypothetical protein C8Q76DRAFT_628841, partial [Earliella scabrosa]
MGHWIRTGLGLRTDHIISKLDYDHVEPPANWSYYAELMKDNDEAMVWAWKEEVDTLLVFAGLFSAVVTAFNIEAYKLLQEDDSQLSVQLLQQISQQLALGANATTGAGTLPSNSNRPAYQPTPSSIRINALWFSSLVCALFSALIGITIKQWVREYMTIISPSSRHSVRLRQYRYDGLIAWHVPEIMALLPILLEISLILFLVGLIDFLLLLQSTVAAIVTSLITVALLCYVAATVAPAISRHCPFRSPKSWLLVRLQRKI